VQLSRQMEAPNRPYGEARPTGWSIHRRSRKSDALVPGHQLA
jgi:hypothetical protein